MQAVPYLVARQVPRGSRCLVNNRLNKKPALPGPRITAEVQLPGYSVRLPLEHAMDRCSDES